MFALCVTALILVLTVIVVAGIWWPLPTEDSSLCRATGERMPRGTLTVAQARLLEVQHSRCSVMCPDRGRAKSRLAVARYAAMNLEPGR
ncbi:hypothetical protein [Nocardia sp. NPDC057030]|uniref:hypothetical protein n=1 Tax=unclassified Nocardia TaxID=2637762 RepID=UPI00362CEB74